MKWPWLISSTGFSLGGVVITGDLTLRIADVDLVRIDLNALISSVNEQVPSPWGGIE